MRIAVSGAVSTGKTTLARALAERLDLAFIEENLDTLFGADPGPRETPEAFAAAIVHCLERKRALEADAGNFVADRCPLDLLNFWQAKTLPREFGGHDIYDLCARYMADYDFVVLTPWNSIPLVKDSVDETGNHRTRDPWLQFKGSAMISGLAHHFMAPAKIIQVPAGLGAPEDRVEFVVNVTGGG